RGKARRCGSQAGIREREGRSLPPSRCGAEQGIVMVWNLGINGVSNANWQTTPLRVTWMNANNVTGVDISPQNNTCTVTYSSGSVTGTPAALLPQYLRPVIST